MTRTITDPSELDALPVGAGFVDKHGDLGLIDHTDEDGVIVQYAETAALSLAFVARRYLPATVVHMPGEPLPEPALAPVVSDAAVPSATRERIARTLSRCITFEPDVCDGCARRLVEADRLLARFTITPRTDR